MGHYSVLRWAIYRAFSVWSLQIFPVLIWVSIWAAIEPKYKNKQNGWRSCVPPLPAHMCVYHYCEIYKGFLLILAVSVIILQYAVHKYQQSRLKVEHLTACTYTLFI